MTLQLKNIAHYMGKKGQTDWWIWTVFLSADEKDELDDVQYVIYNLGRTFTPPIAKVVDRESGFSLTREGSKTFTISAKVEFKSKKDPIILEHELKFGESLRKAEYYIILSTADDIIVNNESIDKFLGKLLTENYTIHLIKKQKNIKNFRLLIDDLRDSSIFLVNTNKQLDSIGFWGLGYAMGKGIPIIGYNDGKSKILIPHDLEELINISSDVNQFVKMISIAFSGLKPVLSIMFEDWDAIYEVVKKTREI